MPYALGRSLESGEIQAALYLPPIERFPSRVALRTATPGYSDQTWEIYPAGLFQESLPYLGDYVEARTLKHTSFSPDVPEVDGWIYYARKQALPSREEFIICGVVTNTGFFCEVDFSSVSFLPIERSFVLPGLVYNYLGMARILGADEKEQPWLEPYRKALRSDRPFVLSTNPILHTGAPA